MSPKTNTMERESVWLVGISQHGNVIKSILLQNYFIEKNGIEKKKKKKVKHDNKEL